jgi:DNA-directed RNA polymerase subunit E'/Rpb7
MKKIKNIFYFFTLTKKQEKMTDVLNGMNVAELTKNICLSPELLTSDILKNIFIKVKETYERKSFKEDGFIFNIKPNFTVINNFVSTSSASQIICKVKFFASVIKPKIKDMFEGRVKAFDERAVVISVDGIMDILISAQRMEGCIFDKGKNAFVETKKDGTKKMITHGDIICAEITAVKFDKKFNCIGKLVKK